MNWESALIVLAVGAIGLPLVHATGIWATKRELKDRPLVWQVDAIIAFATLAFALLAGVA